MSDLSSAERVPPLHRDRSLLKQWCGARTVVVSSGSARRVAREAGLDLAESHHVAASELHPGHLRGAHQVIALGAGATIDTATLAARRAGLPVLIVPTVLSTDAPFSPVTATREHGTVVYHETGGADAVLLDDRVLLTSDWHLHHNGLADLLAVESATLDWLQRNPGKQTGIVAADRALVDTATEDPSIWHHPRFHGWSCWLSCFLRRSISGCSQGTPHSRREPSTTWPTF